MGDDAGQATTDGLLAGSADPVRTSSGEEGQRIANFAQAQRHLAGRCGIALCDLDKFGFEVRKCGLRLLNPTHTTSTVDPGWTALSTNSARRVPVDAPPAADASADAG